MNYQETSQNAYYKIDFDEERKKKNLQRIRRCFMNGKQCIFYNSKTNKSSIKDSLSVFVVMPYRPNLNTFFEWSLKKYLSKELHVPEINIRRADQCHDTGYIMCERVCKNIQDADLIAVDLSIENPNVMYELGIAIGLHKPIIAFCNENNKNRLTEKVLNAIGFKHNNETFPIIYYPGVDELPHDENFEIRNKIGSIPLMPKKTKMKIVPLIINENIISENDSQDISVSFSDALRGAIGVAVNDILESDANNSSLEEVIESIGKDRIKAIGTIIKNKDEIFIEEKKGNGESIINKYHDIVSSVDSAFICIIDLLNENPYSYFWLGYCHARGINSIPIYRKPDVSSRISSLQIKYCESAISGDNNVSSKKPCNQEDKNAIAFDIRALWYFDYKQNEVQKLSTALRSTFAELIANDIPRLQRNIFWERITSEPTVYIYTGAVHHERLKREVVGDWDQRTVSELVRYLSSTDVSVIPKLVNPIYSPQTIKKKLNCNMNDEMIDKLIKDYKEIIKKELRGKNCIIIASADVNPLTEVVLAYAYNIEKVCFKDPTKITLTPVEKQSIVIALKGWKNDAEVNDEEIHTYFSRPGKEEGLSEGKYRGFFVNDTPLQKPYKHQDEVVYASNNSEIDEHRFSLLSHLVILKNPFNDVNNDDQDNIIVLLNGVSGPGTFGLAEVLTGGETDQKSKDSEGILEKLNNQLATIENLEKNKNYVLESIIEVSIEPPSGELIDNTLKEVHEKFSDLRNVSSWELYKDETVIKNNPWNNCKL